MTIYVLTIHHRHGINVYANRTKKGATRALAAYVNDEWAVEVGKTKKPSTRSTMIEEYFNGNSPHGEWYEITDCELGA